MKLFHKPKKSLGQNFLIDKNIIKKIVKIVELNKNKNVNNNLSKSNVKQNQI